MKKALFQRRLKGDYVKCSLCPHECVIPPWNVGRCKVRRNDDGVLNTLNYYRLGGSNVDPIEKKPLYGFYPGRKIASIGSFGCNLSCDFCQNYQMVQRTDRGIAFTKEEVLEWVKKSGGIGLAYTYNEPTVWYETIIELMPEIHDLGLKNVMVSNGFINEKPWASLLPYLDAVNIDVKFLDDETAREVTGGVVEPVWKRIKEAVEADVHVEVTHLVVPGLNDSDEEVEEIAKSMAEIDKKMILHLSRYFPEYKRTTAPTPKETLARLQRVAKKHLDRVYLGNI